MIFRPSLPWRFHIRELSFEQKHQHSTNTSGMVFRCGEGYFLEGLQQHEEQQQEQEEKVANIITFLYGS